MSAGLLLPPPRWSPSVPVRPQRPAPTFMHLVLLFAALGSPVLEPNLGWKQRHAQPAEPGGASGGRISSPAKLDGALGRQDA